MSKAMFSDEVVGTDSFLDLPEEAQLLYFRLGFEGTYGKIVGVRRIARGYGSEKALGILYQSGYLFDYGGACWVRHYWVNNTFKRPNHNYAMTMPEIQSGEIGFEGEAFKSAFVCPDENKPSVSLIQDSSLTGADTGTGTVAGADTGTDSPTFSGSQTDAGEGARGEGEERPCWCEFCRSTNATYTTTSDHKTIIHCPNCGTYEKVKGANKSESETRSLFA